MFSTGKVLEIAREAEAERPAERLHERLHKQLIIKSDKEKEDKILDYLSISLEDGIVVVVPR